MCAPPPAPVDEQEPVDDVVIEGEAPEGEGEAVEPEPTGAEPEVDGQ